MKERVTKTEIKLEDYEHFLENPFDEAFSYQQLNQIIYMHGFKKIHKRRKAVLYEALSTIDLRKPQRSTLKDDFPPYDGSVLTLDQVRQDLQTLLWQECPIQSIEAVHDPTTKDNPAMSKSSGALSSFTISRKRRRVGRRKSLSAVYRGGDKEGNVIVGVLNVAVPESGFARDHDDV